MTVRSSLLLALRYLVGDRGTADRRRSGRRMRGGIIGVGLSLVPLIVVLQVANGMIAGITARFIEAGSFHIQLVARANPELEEVRAATERVAGLPGVTLAAAERQGLGLAASQTQRTGVTIRAVSPGLWEQDAALRRYVEFSDGSWDLSDSSSILLGASVAQELGVSVGDDIRIVTARPLSGGRMLPRSASFTVRGIFSSGYQDLDRLWVFVPFERGFDLLPESVSRQIVGIKISDPLLLPNPLHQAGVGDDAEAREEALTTLTAVRDIGGTDWRTATWFELDRAKYMSFKTTKNLLIFIMVLIVLVAAVNISSTLVMLVLEKQEEIAILKSMGASPAGVRRLFVTAGFILGSAGTAAGIAVGLLLAVNINQLLYAIEWLINTLATLATILARPFTELSVAPVTLLSEEYYLESIPMALRMVDLLLVAGLSILLSTAAAFFPARRAARIRPREILQKH